MSINPKDVNLMRDTYEGLLGRGKFDVYKCLANGDLRAIKCLSHGGSRQEIEDMKTCLRREIDALQKVQGSPNVVRLIGVVEYQYWSGIVMEYLPRGNLADFIKKCNPSYQLRLRIIKNIADGLCYLHHNVSSIEAVSHNDLKPQNVVLDENFVAKICDFDGSDVIARTSGIAYCRELRCISGFTENYAAPELLSAIRNQCRKIQRQRSMDVFSFSMIIYFILSGDHPFGDIESETVMKNYIENRRPKTPTLFEFASHHDHTSLDQLLNQMILCWSQEPHERPKIEAVVETLHTCCDLNEEDLSEEINRLERENPLSEEDHNKFCLTFDEFCKLQRHRVDVQDTVLGGGLTKATASSVVTSIEVGNIHNNLNLGDTIHLTFPDKFVVCRVENVYPKQ